MRFKYRIAVHILALQVPYTNREKHVCAYECASKSIIYKRLCNPNDVFINDGVEPFFTPI